MMINMDLEGALTPPRATHNRNTNYRQSTDRGSGGDKVLPMVNAAFVR
jgi:hypothetical protein